jgi:hypothetical protein
MWLSDLFTEEVRAQASSILTHFFDEEIHCEMVRNVQMMNSVSCGKKKKKKERKKGASLRNYA